MQQHLGHSHQTLWRADESSSIQGSSEQKLFNTPSLRAHTNSLNIPASPFYIWLLTKTDTEGDVVPHPTHFWSQVTHLANPVGGGKQQGLRVKSHLLSESFRGKEGKYPLKSTISSFLDKLLSCSWHSFSLCSQHLSYRPQNHLPHFENKSSVGLKTHSDGPSVVNEVKSHRVEGSSCPGAQEQPCSLSSFNSWFPKAPTFFGPTPSPLVQVQRLCISRVAALAWAAATIQISILNLG